MGPSLTASRMLLRPGWASETSLVPAYEQAFVRTLLAGQGKAIAFGRGRVALWAILKAIGVDAQSEVVVPAYTCETVPMAVKFAGARCVYADVTPGGYNVSERQVAPLLTERTKAIICQHTYGIVQPVQEWVQFAANSKVFLIEDRCQLVQNDPTGNEQLALGDAAYFSTHFSKPFSTTQGGMAVFREPRACVAAGSLREGFPHAYDCRRTRSLAIQTLLYATVVRPATRALVGSLFRWAQRAGLIRGTISADEYGRTMPADYLSRATNLQAALGMAELDRWEQNRRHRERLTSFYLERLERLGADTSTLRIGGARPALLMVPVLVQNKRDILRRAMGRGLPIGTWFDRLGAHVNERSARLYDYVPGQCPYAEYLMSREIHLLTISSVSMKQASKAIRFLERYACLADPYRSPTCANPSKARIRQTSRF